MQELDQSVIDVTVMMGEGFNFYVTEGVACGRSESECSPWTQKLTMRYHGSQERGKYLK